MIRTRYGSEVKIIKGDVEAGTVDVRTETGIRRGVWISELRSNGGINEIMNEIKKANEEGEV